MKLSVILPVYNNEQTLRAVLNSLRTQSYENFEVMIVNDGSTDDSQNIINEYVQADRRFHSIEQKHLGTSAARNVALSMSQGEFVTFVDGDDLVPPDGFKYMHQVSAIYECDIIIGRCRRIDGVSERAGRPESLLADQFYHLQKITMDNIQSFALGSKWFRRTLLDDNKLAFEGYTQLENGIFLFSCLAHARNVYTTPEIVYLYRRTLPSLGRNLLQTPDKELLDNAQAAYERILELTEEYGETFRKEFDYIYFNEVLISGFYRRLWKLSDECLEELTGIILERFAAFDEVYSTKAVFHNQDILTYGHLTEKKEMVSNPLVTVAVGREMTPEFLPSFLQDLYDQAVPSFRVIIDKELKGVTDDIYQNMPNLFFASQYALREALEECSSKYITFIDTDMVYDHWALHSMINTMKDRNDLDFTALQPKNVLEDGTVAPNYATEQAYEKNMWCFDPFLANKLFLTAAIREQSLDMIQLYKVLPFKKLPEPAMVSFVSEEALFARAEQIDPEAVRQVREADAGDREPKQRGGFRFSTGKALELLGIVPEKDEEPDPEPEHTWDPVEYYLNEDIDPGILLIDNTGGSFSWSTLQFLRDIHEHGYDEFTIYLAVHESVFESTKAIMAFSGTTNVTLLSTADEEYDRILFSAGRIISVKNQPARWIKKPGQIVVNLYFRTFPELPDEDSGRANCHTADAVRNTLMSDYIVFQDKIHLEYLKKTSDVIHMTKADALCLNGANRWESIAPQLLHFMLSGDTSDFDIEPIGEEPEPLIFIISDGLNKSAATGLLYELSNLSWLDDNVFVSFREPNVEENLESAYPIIRNARLFATSGTPLSERTERRRLYGDLPVRSIVLLDVDDPDRLRAFARFEEPVSLFVQPELSRRILANEEDVIRSIRMINRRGNEIYTLDEGIAESIGKELSIRLKTIYTAEEFFETFIKS
jgi:glycosyltransferase involved in cell wall biosynthesis